MSYLHSMVKKLIKPILISIALLVVLVAFFFGLVYAGVFGKLYTREELKEFSNETASVVQSEDGKIIGKFFSENRTNVQFRELPDHLVQALLAAEDVRFYDHHGVDTRSLIRVLIKSILLRQEEAGGGSTITQQLAKNMYGRADYGFFNTPANKFKEIILANRLEHIYSKEDILQLYFNTVPFGEDVFGIESAAQRYFNKSAGDLKVEEGAVLIGMLKANTYYNPRLNPMNAVRRRNVVLDQMFRYEFIGERSKDSLQQLPMKMDYSNLTTQGTANYFLELIKKDLLEIIDKINKTEGTDYNLYKSGLVIETTMNAELQELILGAYKQHLKKMQILIDKQYKRGKGKKQLEIIAEPELKRMGKDQNVEIKKRRELFSWDGFYSDSISVKDSLVQELTRLHAGFLALDPRTGAIRAWVGGIDFRRYPYDQIFAQRQIASAFKPVLYAAALESGVGPCQYLDNDPLVFKDLNNWAPQNYDKSFGGKYSVAAALAQSMNIPSINLFLGLPFTNIHKTWTNLGFSQPLEANPSAALGTANASIYELAIAYSAFANGGRKIHPKSIVTVKTAEGKIIYAGQFTTSRERVLTKETSLLMTAMLQKAVREGTGRALAGQYGIQMDVAGKTGTSQDYADAWFAAYNKHLVLVTRVGCNLPKVHFSSGVYGSGGALALPLVGLTLKEIQKSPSLRKKVAVKFDALSEDLAMQLACEDQVEDSRFENMMNELFKKQGTTSEKAAKKAERESKKGEKESFFKRLFKKKEKN